MGLADRWQAGSLEVVVGRRALCGEGFTTMANDDIVDIVDIVDIESGVVEH